MVEVIMSGSSPYPPLAGRRLYSPGTIVAYFLLANFSLALALMGLNVRARGRQVLGGLVILAAALAALTLLVPTQVVRQPSLGTRGRDLLGEVLCAFILYHLEKRPYLTALAQGACRARWWPPAVWLFAFIAIVLVLS
jgi:hypothetical protein